MNGDPLDEPYTFDDLPFGDGVDCDGEVAAVRCFAPVIVPAGEYLVRGDHPASVDSVARCRGFTLPKPDCARFVGLGALIGQPFARIWPLDDAGGLG